MKKLLIIVISLICVLTASLFVIKNLNTNTDDISKILKSDMSTFDQSEAINEKVESKLSECEKLKNDIMLLIEALYTKNETVGSYFSNEEIIKSFNSYYEDSVNKIDAQTSFDEYRCAFKYLSGSEASVEIASLKYSYCVDLYDELNKLYVYLNELK